MSEKVEFSDTGAAGQSIRYILYRTLEQQSECSLKWRQAARQTDRQAGRQTDRQANKKEEEGWRHGQAEKQRVGSNCRWVCDQQLTYIKNGKAQPVDGKRTCQGREGGEDQLK